MGNSWLRLSWFVENVIKLVKGTRLEGSFGLG